MVCDRRYLRCAGSGLPALCNECSTPCQPWLTPPVPPPPAAITGFTLPYFTAFGSPGFYPYGSSTTIVVYVCLVVILVDICVNFRVARYKDGRLVTNPRELALSYLRDFFFVDILSIIPFDEIALAIAGLNGPDYVNNEQLAYYLALLRLVGMVSSEQGCWACRQGRPVAGTQDACARRRGGAPPTMAAA